MPAVSHKLCAPSFFVVKSGNFRHEHSPILHTSCAVLGIPSRYCVVPLPRANYETFVPSDPNRNGAPRTIENLVLWCVGNAIARVELLPDGGEASVEVVDVDGVEGATAALTRKLGEKVPVDASPFADETTV